jgi:transglutaminase-like putative cysteine protease
VKRARPGRVRVAHAVALSAATLALALSLREVPAFLLGLGLLAAGALALPFAEWTSVPPRLERSLPRVLGTTLLVTAGVAWLSRALGVLVLEPTFLPMMAAPVLVPMAVAFALAPRAFSPGRTLLPTVLTILGLAGLDPSPAGYGPSALPFLGGGDHNAFSEQYLLLALVILGALWSAALFDAGPRWQARDRVGLALAGTLAAALAATGIVGLPLLQPRIERALAQALDQGESGLSGESTLGEFAELALSRRRILDLRTSDPQAGPWLLRSEVFTDFDGRHWRNVAGRSRAVGPGAPSTALLRPGAAPARVGPLLADTGAWFAGPGRANATSGGGDEARGTVDILVNQQEVSAWPLLLPRRLTAVTVDAPFLEVDRFGSIRRPSGLPLRLYGARLADVESPEPLLSEDDRGESLALPAVVDERLRALAGGLAPGADPRGQLAATVAHLQAGYRYTLRPGAFHTADPLAEFLFEKKAGYCEYFASAAVVLLRLQGVPARFVKGLSVGAQTDQGGGLHVVRDSDAHAWVEAWIPGAGWVEADPTPPGQFAEAHARASGVERFLQHLRAALSAGWARLVVRGPASFLRHVTGELTRLAVRAAREPVLWLAALTAALAPRLIRYWRSRRQGRRAAALDTSPAVPAELRALVRVVERRWVSVGHPRPPGRGLLEHARSLLPGGAPGPPVSDPMAAAARDVVEAYYRARFGGEAPDAVETARLRQELRA